jgi:hypothetical protein
MEITKRHVAYETETKEYKQLKISQHVGSLYPPTRRYEIIERLTQEFQSRKNLQTNGILIVDDITVFANTITLR